MSRFVLTAQLQLQAPRNVNQVVNQLQRQLNGVNVNLNVQGGRQATRQIAQVNQQVNNLNKGAKNLGKNFAVSIKRFAAFSIANRAVSLFSNKLAAAVEESIEFQRELIKIKQVSGATNQALSNLTSTITDLSTGLGTSSKDLLATSRILAQTGLQAAQLEVALSALAKTTLAPTFENIEKTAEGAVAILAQFGQGVGALESQLGSINAVAGQFAVESGDLISAVRRTGGVFKSAGGDLNELLGLFTSVRATTRESAESIATGLRTIFTRIQRPKTIEFLKQYGVELTNLEGKFVGPFEAVRQLSQQLQGLEQGDIRFVQIAEELGGFRQIGKVIPLIQQFETAERARAAAVKGSSSLDRDAQTAQEALAVQIQKTRENFLALIRSLSETTSFQVLVKTTLGLADALIKVADALKPIVPLLGAFAGFKIAKGIGSFAGGLRGAFGKSAGGPIGLASGGVVPGTGNRDTVPAMLTPGEFVIRKSSVQKIGADKLAGMNKYANGGNVTRSPSELASSKPYVKVSGTTYSKPDKTDFDTGTHRFNKKDKINFLRTKTKEIDVNKLNPKRKDVKAYKKAKTAQRRGIMFEDIAEKEHSLTIAGGSSRLDASGPGGYLYEIKSELKALSDSKLAEKMVGASISPISNIDKNVQKKLRNQELSAKAEDIPLGRAGVIQDITNGLGKFFGGGVQKFALGGLATKNRVGFAILDPDQGGSDLSASVTRAQVRGAVSGTDAQKKALDKELSWSSKKFSVTRQGLPEKTSKKFYDTISQEATEGVGRAASSLSQTLGQGSVSMPDTAKQTMNDVIKKSGSQMGRLFEDVLDVIDNGGDFKPAPKGAFWDFKTGLTGGLASTYNKMPSSFVDARTSYGRSNAGAAQSKIIGEIAEEYEKSSTYKNAKKQSKAAPASALAAQEKRRAKQAAKMAKMREQAGFAKGGAASDTVPALLTPGEFVINAKSASKIGKANLDRMNKKGVAGFASGGPVGKVQRFQNGGQASGGRDLTALAILLPTVIDSMIPTVEKTDEEIEQLGTTSFDFRNALSELITTVGIAGVALSSFGVSIKGLPNLIKNQFAGKRTRAKLTQKINSGKFTESEFNRAADLQSLDVDRRRRSERAAVGARNFGRSKLGLGRGAANILGKGVGGVVKVFSRFAGPVGIAAGGLFALNKVIGAGLGLQEKFNNAVKLGNVERAKELAVLKEAPAFISLFGEGAAEAYVNFASAFGGNSLESVKANAEAQALAGKTTKEFEANSKLANEALRELKDGTRTAADAFASGDLTRNLRNTLEQGAAELKAAQASYANELNRFAGTFRNWLANLTGLGSTDAELEETASAKREEARQKTFDKTSKAIDALGESTRIRNREFILSGKSFDDAIDNLKEGLEGVNLEATLTVAKAEELGRAFENQQKEIISNLKIAKALNSSLFTLDSTLKGLNVNLADSVAKSRGEFDRLSSTLNKLEAVTKGAALDQREFRDDIISLGKTLSGAGVDRGIIRDVQDQFRDLNKITNSFGNALNDVRVDENFVANPEAFLNALQAKLVDSVDTSSFKELLKDDKIFEGLGLTDLDKDISEILKELIPRLAKGATVDLEVLKELQTAYSLQAKIIKQVAKTEKELLDIRIAGIDSEIRGAELLEEFGVKTFTVSKRIELLNKKLQVNLGEKVSSNAESLSAALSAASSKLAERTEALSNSENEKARQEIINEIDKERTNIDRLNSSINDRILIEKEALKVAREKLKLDQQAIDSLLSGNIEDFLRQQEAAAARRALVSGNAAAVGNFSPRALGEAMKSITDVDQRRTAAQTGVTSGLFSQSMANVLTENTREINDLRTDIENLSDVLNQGAVARQKEIEAQKRIAKDQQLISEKETERVKQALLDSSRKQATSNALLGEKIATQETALIENTKAIEKFTEAVTVLRAQEAGTSGKIIGGKQESESFKNLPKEEKANLNSQRRAMDAVIRGEKRKEDEKGFFERYIIDGYKTLFRDTETERQQLLQQRREAAKRRTALSRGGPVYASSGMFVPRGTDTVPAMLTPGEFVVNRKAVNTGNNRQILEEMNGGSSQQNGVYYNNGGEVGASVDTTALKAIATSLSSSFSKFNDTVNRLINFKFEMTIAPTRVDVVINTPQAMEQMSSQAKEQLLTAVVDEISINQLGKLRRNRNA